jgi:hypothetical protein
MEEHRPAITPDAIVDYLRRAIEGIDGLPTHFIFNTDEMGHQEWADRHEQTGFVPAYHVGDQVGYPVSCAGKRITLVACIAADGSSLKPLVIIPRKTIDDDFRLTGLTAEKVMTRSQSKGYVDVKIFETWLVAIFFAEVRERRDRVGYDGRAVLILDNCTAHATERFHALCDEHNVLPLFLPPHSSNQLHPLDGAMFGITKRMLVRANRMNRLNIQTQYVAQVVCVFLSTATPTNITKNFRNSGINLLIDEDRLEFYRKMLRGEQRGI